MNEPPTAQNGHYCPVSPIRAHWWRLPSPNGTAEVNGMCRYCRQRRAFFVAEQPPPEQPGHRKAGLRQFNMRARSYPRRGEVWGERGALFTTEAVILEKEEA